MIKLPSYPQRNRYGIFYFRIAIPKAVQVHFPKKEIVKSLRTAVKSEAIVASQCHLWGPDLHDPELNRRRRCFATVESLSHQLFRWLKGDQAISMPLGQKLFDCPEETAVREVNQKVDALFEHLFKDLNQ